MISLAVLTNRIGRARQAERGVDAQIRFRYGMNVKAMWSRRCTAGASAGNTLPATYADGMFVGQHESWNRRPDSGHKVIFVPFENGKPSGGPPVGTPAIFLKEIDHE